MIAAAGGDGTIHEVVNGLLRGRPERPPALAVIPVGTANILVRALGLPRDPGTVARALRHGVRRRIDVGQVNDRYYTTIAGIGHPVGGNACTRTNYRPDPMRRGARRAGRTEAGRRPGRSRARRGGPAVAADAAIRDWLVARCHGTYRRGNWAGKGALPSIEGVSVEVAHCRHPDEHTIAEIVLHMAYWKDAVTARLTGQSWKFDDRLNWRPAAPGEQGWVEARSELAAAHKRLMAALRGLTSARLLERVRGPLRLIDLVADIATHDTYHAAQIFILRRLPASG